MNDFTKGEAAYALLCGRIAECTIIGNAMTDPSGEPHYRIQAEGFRPNPLIRASRLFRFLDDAREAQQIWMAMEDANEDALHGIAHV